MNPFNNLLFTLLFLALGYPALCAAPPGWVPGQYDRQILTELQAAGQNVKLRQTSLKETAPQYWVEADPQLSWEAALGEAAKNFKDDPIRRVLFLANYLKEGDPVSRIKEMHLPGWIGFTLTFGFGYVESHELMGQPDISINTGAKPEHGTSPRWFLSPIALTILHNREKILSPCSLLLRDLAVNGMKYSELRFAMDGTLTGFSRQIELANSAVSLKIGGNISGEGGTDFYYAQVLIDGKWVESIDYTPDKIIESRQVFKHDGSGCLYMEHYSGGKLTKRMWYKDVQTDHGTQSVIDRTETF